jgi:hypothetical protein
MPKLITYSMTKNISNFLFSNLLKTFAISSLLTLIIFQVINYPREQLDFDGREWWYIDMVMLVIWTMILTISSFSIFLNNYKSVRSSIISCFFSFFLSPIIITFVGISISNRNAKDWGIFFTSTITFILIHFYFYFKFLERNKLDNLEELND